MNILNKLTIKHLKMNKKRTIVTIIGIILSTALMVGMGLLLSSFRESMIKEISIYNGDYHAKYNDLEEAKINLIENNGNVEEYYYKKLLGYSLIDNFQDEFKPYYKVYEASETYLEKLRLISGELPKNSDEIIITNTFLSDNNVNIEIGDTITLDIGNRYLDDMLLTKEDYIEEEHLENTFSKTYIVVGVIQRDVLEDYSSVGYEVFTKSNKDSSNNIEMYVKYKKPKDTYKLSETIASILKIDKNQISYNDSLLSMYGASKYDNFLAGMSLMLAIMLGLVSIACIIVIYNSFAISVMERKKQFGLFSSIGATKKQIKKTVLFEALIVSLIGIPLGILGSYLGIGVVICILNNLLKGMIEENFVLCTYPLFLIIPIIFMIVTIIISAILPARRASKISPIEAIRLNDDIKIKGKKVKSPKIIRKLFGIEGDIAYKNIKRNKNKYRITVISLFISIVLFISFSGYLAYMLGGTKSYISAPGFDLVISYDSKANKKEIESIKKDKAVKDYADYTDYNLTTKTDFSEIFTDKMAKYVKDNNYDIESMKDIIIIILDDESYNNYLKKLNKKEMKPILYNNFNEILYKENSRKSYTLTKYKNKIIDIDLSEYNYDEKENEELKQISVIKDYYISSESFLSSEMFSSISPLIIMNEEQANQYNISSFANNPRNLIIKAPNYKELDKQINEKIKNGKLNLIYYANYSEQFKMLKNFVLALKILIYGFIALVTLIGITSVFNTINTSIALRRKEFAVLRSMGLTPKGFTKMLCFESLFFGLKALFFGLPVSFFILYLMYLSMKNIVEFDGMIIPWMSVLLAIFGIFIVIGISMLYATSKIKNENIIDAIFEENI